MKLNSDRLKNKHHKNRWLACIPLVLLTLVFGCATSTKIDNELKDNNPDQESYSAVSATEKFNDGDVTILIAFSGGGTRAAAFSYGVLKALNDTQLKSTSNKVSILDEVDLISSVSGGSFTSAYYGLYGTRIFSDFENDFLYKDIGRDLYYNFINPLNWALPKNRTDRTVDYYQNILFDDATFEDMKHPDRPLIMIGASDLARGVRFTFVQEYFDLICSDLSSFPVARAVTASSAVPVLFNPIVLENHDGCHDSNLLQISTEPSVDDIQSRHTVAGLLSYGEKAERKYIHLVDGGITDNLGVLSFSDLVQAAGGDEDFFGQIDVDPDPYYLLIVVDASTSPRYEMEKSKNSPSIKETLSAMSDAQLHRYNDVSKKIISNSIKDWGQILSNNKINVKTYFIDINLEDVYYSSKKDFYNHIPTDFTLEQEEVRSIIDEGYQQLINNTTFNSFLEDFNLP